MVGIKTNNVDRSIDLAYLKNVGGAAAVQVRDDNGFSIQNLNQSNSVTLTASGAAELTISGSLKMSATSFLDVVGRTTPGASASSQGRIYFDSGLNAFQISQNTGAFAYLVKTAGSGLTETSGSIAINVDSSTIEINANTLRIKDLGVTTAKLANNAVTPAKTDLTQTWDFSSGVLRAASPVGSSDVATKTYVDATYTGLRDAKESVRAATTANITLSGTQTIDGVAVIAGDRVLVKNQTTASENGIYVVAAGAWSRSADADQPNEITPGMYVFVEGEGTTNLNSGWVVSTTGTITIGTTSINFVKFTQVGSGITGTLTAGRVAVASGSNTLDSGDATFTFNTATHVLTLGDGGTTKTKIAQNAGTLTVSGESALAVTATAANAAGSNYGLQHTITGSGTSSSDQGGEYVIFNAGYTGSGLTSAYHGYSAAAGTGTTIDLGGANNLAVNTGAQFRTEGGGTGTNLGSYSLARGAGNSLHAGAVGVASGTHASATNVGVIGNAHPTNGGTRVGGYFGFDSSTIPTYTNAALIADNTTVSAPIFLGRANGVTKFTIASDGAVTAATSVTVSNLTATRVTFAGTAGLLSDAASLTFNSGTGALSATSFVGAGTVSGLTAGRVAVASGSNTLDSGDANFTFDTAGHTLTLGGTNKTRIIHTGGALGANESAHTVSATLNATAAHQKGVYVNISSSGSAAGDQTSLLAELQTGYTGGNATSGVRVLNGAAGTGTDITGDTANYGVRALTNGSTVGAQAAIYGSASGGSTGLRVGVLGFGNNSASGTGAGVVGLATSVGTRVGGWFSLASSTPTIDMTAALLADNGSVSAPIFLARNNGTTKFTVDATGNVLVANFGTAGTVVYNSSTSGQLAATAVGTSGQALLSAGSSAPAFGNLGTAAGGTGLSGATPFNANGVMYASSTSALTTTAAGTTGQVLIATTGSAPTWGTASGTLSGLTSPRIPYAATSSTLADNANLTWDNTNVILTLGGSSTARFVHTAGTLATGTNAVSITATHNASAVTETAILDTITSAGTGVVSKIAHTLAFATGSYVSAGGTYALNVTNTVAGTGADLQLTVTETGILGNQSMRGLASGSTTTGYNVGVHGEAGHGLFNVGTLGKAITATNATNNIGAIGVAANGSSNNVGGYFALGGSSTPTFTSAAIVADNGAVSAPIFLGKANGTTKFTIASDGAVTAATSVTVSNLTATRIVFSGTAGLLSDASTLTFTTGTNTLSSTNLTATSAVTAASITDSGLTSGRVTFAGVSGLLSDSSVFTFSAGSLTSTNLTATSAVTGASVTDSGLTATRLTFAGTGGLLQDNGNLTWDNTNIILTLGGVATSRLVHTAGTLATGTVAHNTTATLNGSAVTEAGTLTTITSGGTGVVAKYGQKTVFTSGYTSAGTAVVAYFLNSVAGTGADPTVGSASDALGNVAVEGEASAGTAGYNFGGYFRAAASTTKNFGVVGKATGTATNIGVLGSANGGTDCAGLFTLTTTSNPTIVAAALIADNGLESVPVFLGRVNSVTKFTVDATGNVLVANFATAGTVVYNSSASGQLAATAVGTSGQALLSAGAGAPAFGNLGTAAGGTGLSGATPFTSGGVMYASSTSALTTTALGTPSQVLIGGTTPAFGTVTSSMVNSTIIVAAGTNAFTGNQDFGTNNITGVNSLSANTVQASTTNGNLTIQPNGTGTKVIVTAGKILDVDTVEAATTNGNLTLQPNGSGTTVIVTGGKTLSTDTLTSTTAATDLTLTATGSNVTVATGKSFKITGASSGAVPYFNASAQMVTSVTGTASQVLIGGTTPSFSSVTSSMVNSTIIVASGANAFTGNQSLGGFNLTNVGAITANTVTDSGLTQNQIVFAGSGGTLSNSANLTYDGTTFTAKAAVVFSTDTGVTFKDGNATPVAGKTTKVITVNTTNATVTPILVDGTEFTIADSTVHTYVAYISARCTGGTGGNTGKGLMIKMEVAAKAAAGTASIIGTEYKTQIANEQDGTWDVTMTVSTNKIRFNATGGANDNITWTGWVEETTI